MPIGFILNIVMLKAHFNSYFLHHNMNPLKRKLNAFSLIEILISLLMISLIAFFSVKGISDYFEARNQSIFMKKLYDDLKWARIEAIILHEKVRVQPNLNWCDGWRIITESGSVLKVHSGMKGAEILFSSFPDLQYMQFSPQGSSDYQNATFTLINSYHDSMEIIVNQAGRVRWER